MRARVPRPRFVPSRASAVRDGLQDVVDRLCAEYATSVAAGSVIRCVARCTEVASRSGVPRAHLPEAVEQMARATLDDRLGHPRATSTPAVDLRHHAARA